MKSSNCILTNPLTVMKDVLFWRRYWLTDWHTKSIVGTMNDSYLHTYENLLISSVSNLLSLDVRPFWYLASWAGRLFGMTVRSIVVTVRLFGATVQPIGLTVWSLTARPLGVTGQTFQPNRFFAIKSFTAISGIIRNSPLVELSRPSKYVNFSVEFFLEG